MMTGFWKRTSTALPMVSEADIRSLCSMACWSLRNNDEMLLEASPTQLLIEGGAEQAPGRSEITFRGEVR